MINGPVQYPHFCRAAVLLFFLIGPCYLHTVDAAWHLDDIPNIVANPRVQMDAVSIDAIQNSFYASPQGSKRLYRPVAMLTFALNWRHGGDKVMGYHWVNILIHMSAALFLFLAVLKLFSAPNLRSFKPEDAYFVALLTAILWALHPIQISAVTYLVQRMASLSALFYLIAVWSYVSGRFSRMRHRRILWFSGCLLAYILAFYTKENTIFLPVVLILVELIFFQSWDSSRTKKCFQALTVAGLLISAGVVIYVSAGGEMGYWLNKYRIRPFNVEERLLTQFRVLIFYLSQIAYPVPSQFSITHDFPLSSSLITPWTTLPSLIFIAGLIGFAAWGIPKGPVLKIIGFSILFFFINHIAESTILPLELVFEHRNYLPSFFLFVPAAIGIKIAFNYYREHGRAMFGFLVFSTCALISAIGMSTYIRNTDWRTEKSLWQDAMIKAPNSARPLHNLAWGYYSPTGRFERAIDLYQRALYLKDETIGFDAAIYFNLAGIYYSRLTDDDKAIEYAKKTLSINPVHSRAGYVLAAATARLGRYKEALAYLEMMPDNLSDNANNLYLKGLLYLKTQQPENALPVFRRCLALAPNHWRYLREIGFSLDLMQFHDQAFWFFSRSESQRPNQPELLMGLAANRVAAGRPLDAQTFIARWIKAIGADNIESYLDTQIADSMGPPVPYAHTAPLISEMLNAKSDHYRNMSHRLLMRFLTETQCMDNAGEEGQIDG